MLVVKRVSGTRRIVPCHWTEPVGTAVAVGDWLPPPTPNGGMRRYASPQLVIHTAVGRCPRSSS
jgi:hypothetical protein